MKGDGEGAQDWEERLRRRRTHPEMKTRGTACDMPEREGGERKEERMRDRKREKKREV